MSTDTIRIGMVGAGANTRLRHVPGFRNIPGVELVGVVNRSRESSERAAAEFEIPRVFDSWQELVDDDEIDAVMIGAVSKYLDTYSDNHGIRKESLSSGLEFTTFLVSTKTGDVVWGARFVGNQEIGLRSLFKSEPIWMSREKLSRGIMKNVLKSFYKTRSVQK